MVEKNWTNWNQPQSNRTKYAKSNSRFKTINGFELSNSFILQSIEWKWFFHRIYNENSKEKPIRFELVKKKCVCIANGKHLSRYNCAVDTGKAFCSV